MGNLFKKLNDKMEMTAIKNNNKNIQESKKEMETVEKKVLFENYVSNLISDLENTKEGVKDGEQK